MRRIAIAVTLASTLVLPAAAQAGGWATVTLAPRPSGLRRKRPGRRSSRCSGTDRRRPTAPRRRSRFAAQTDRRRSRRSRPERRAPTWRGRVPQRGLVALRGERRAHRDGLRPLANAHVRRCRHRTRHRWRSWRTGVALCPGRARARSRRSSRPHAATGSSPGDSELTRGLESGTGPHRAVYYERWWAGHSTSPSSCSVPSGATRTPTRSSFACTRDRLSHRLRLHRRGRGCAGGRPGRLRQGLPRAGAVPSGRAVPAVAVEDRGQRGPEPPPRGGEEEGLVVRAMASAGAEDAAPSPKLPSSPPSGGTSSWRRSTGCAARTAR